LAAVPTIGRASGVEGLAPVEADLTRALYEQYANQIFRYCLHQLGSREEAEDAVQSTFLNAFRGLKRGVVPELESAWLFKIAHNVCLSRRRSSWRRGRVESPADFELVEELTPAPSRRADELIGLQDVLEEMPEAQRRAILLREWQGLSYREIADELELSQAAVETLIFRARRALAAGLEQPPAPRRRLARALDLGNLAAAVKSLVVGGSVAAKVAATVAVVSASTLVAAEPYASHHALTPPPAQASPTSPATNAAPAVPLTHAAPVAAAPVVHAAAPPVRATRRHVPPAHRRPAPAAPAPVTAAPVESAPPPVAAAAPERASAKAKPSHGRPAHAAKAKRPRPGKPDGDEPLPPAAAAPPGHGGANPGHGPNGNGNGKAKGHDEPQPAPSDGSASPVPVDPAATVAAVVAPVVPAVEPPGLGHRKAK
jgi:RNA polymerase sigma factor (sigma-70 family)